MRNVERILGNYWIGYYFVYLVAVLILLYRHNWTLAQWDDVELLSNVFSTAAGYALVAVVVVEGLGRMVLLIPKTVRSILNKGRQQERKRMLAAYRETYARGIPPYTPEFEEFLLDFDPDKPDDSR